MPHWSQDIITQQQAQTLDGLFYQRLLRSPQQVAYRWFDRATEQWCALTWQQVGDEIARWRTALQSEGVQAGDRVALLLRNSPQWVIFDQAALSLGLINVPLYTDDRAENAAYILNDAEVAVLLVQDDARWQRIAAALEDAPWPKRVVLLDADSPPTTDDARVVRAADWLPTTAAPWSPRQADPDTLATIVYTSGTTGRPKGVMLSHRNILSNVAGGMTMMTVYREDVFLSFLPLSHMLERMAGYYLPMMGGATVAYARSVNQLAEDLITVRPTVLIAVPRIFERVYQRLTEQLRQRPALVQRLFQLTQKVGWSVFERSQGRGGWHPRLLLWPLLRRRVARPILDRLGGRLRVAVSGGAALPPDVGHLFLSLGLPLLQGYGLTETSPVISVNLLDDNHPTSVGVLLPDIEARIADNNELLVRGPGVMQGYWNNPEATERVLDREGWLHTGDQARFSGRHLYITGRIKDILVLSNGEKVPPGDMEMALGLDPLFDQALVIGEGQSFLTALVVLNADHWPELAAQFQLDPQAADSLSDPRLLKSIIKRVQNCLIAFPGFAKIRRVTPLLEPWSIDNGLLTPTMKIKRPQVLERYRSAVEQMYQEL